MSTDDRNQANRALQQIQAVVSGDYSSLYNPGASSNDRKDAFDQAQYTYNLATSTGGSADTRNERGRINSIISQYTGTTVQDVLNPPAEEAPPPAEEPPADDGPSIPLPDRTDTNLGGDVSFNLANWGNDFFEKYGQRDTDGNLIPNQLDSGKTANMSAEDLALYDLDNDGQIKLNDISNINLAMGASALGGQRLEDAYNLVHAKSAQMEEAGYRSDPKTFLLDDGRTFTVDNPTLDSSYEQTGFSSSFLNESAVNSGFDQQAVFDYRDTQLNLGGEQEQQPDAGKPDDPTFLVPQVETFYVMRGGNQIQRASSPMAVPKSAVFRSPDRQAVQDYIDSQQPTQEEVVTYADTTPAPEVTVPEATQTQTEEAFSQPVTTGYDPTPTTTTPVETAPVTTTAPTTTDTGLTTAAAPPPVTDYTPVSATVARPVSTVGLGSVPTFGGGYQTGSTFQPPELDVGDSGVQTVTYRNERGQQMPVTLKNGQPITYVPPGYVRSMSAGGFISLDAENDLAKKFLGYTGEKSRTALDNFYQSNSGAAARMGEYEKAITGMAYGGYTGGPAERGRGAPAASPAPRSQPAAGVERGRTQQPSVSTPPPQATTQLSMGTPVATPRNRDNKSSQSQQTQQAFAKSTPTTQTKPLQYSDTPSNRTEEQRTSNRMKEKGIEYTYTDDKGSVLGEGDSQKSIFDVNNPWVDAFKTELDSQNLSYDQVGSKIIVPNKMVEESKNTKFGLYQGKFFIKGKDPIYGNNFEVGLKYDPVSNETTGSFDYSVPFDIKKLKAGLFPRKGGMNRGGMVTGYQEGGETTDPVETTEDDPSGIKYQEEIVPMFQDVVKQTMQPIQAPVSYISPTADQDIGSGAGQVSGTAPYADAATLGTVETATTPGVADTATYGATSAAKAVGKAVEGTTAATGKVSDETQVDAAQQTESSVSGMQSAQGAANIMENPVQREIQEGELISGAADAEKAAKFTEQVQAAEATPTKMATVQGQLEGLMQDFEGGATPPWASGAMRAVSAAMAARGLGASSMAGQAMVQAAMESALPIAQADAQTVAQFESQNLSNRQQRAMLAAQQRAQFMGQEFDQEFQSRVQNSARIGDVANMNFTAEQNIAMENSRAVNTMNMANLTNKQAMVMAEVAAIANLDMANLNNRQQAAVQNAQAFLQMDMANLGNEQQTALFKAQQNVQALFTDQAATNAASQFNATSENQTNQFFASLASQTSQFNATQTNAVNQANVNAVNSVRQFNSNMQNQRDQFNANNGLVVAQANAQWRQNLSTINTATQNESNRDFAKTMNAMTSKNIDAVWQRERDIMSLAFQTAESNADNATSIILQQMAAEATLTASELQAKIEATQSTGNFLSEVFLKIIDL